MTLFKLPKMTKDETEKLLQEQMLCRIAFKGEKHPYIAPFQYVFFKGSLYFHFTDYGRKMKLIGKDERVCVEIESFQPDFSEYKFVVLQGSLKTVTDPKERAEVIVRMRDEGERKLSPNFLAAHGFNSEDGWTQLSPEKPMFIMKLGEVSEILGLSSPQ